MLPWLGLFKKFLPYPTSLILEYYIYFILFIIPLIIIRRIIRVGYIRAFIIWKDGTQSIKDYKVKDGKLMVRNPLIKREEKQWTPSVHPENIIPAKQTIGNKLKFWGFKQRDCLICVEGALECVALKGLSTLKSRDYKKDASKVVASELLRTYTVKEIQNFIKKAIAKATVERKLFSDMHFYIFVSILIINMFLLFMVANRVGAI